MGSFFFFAKNTRLYMKPGVVYVKGEKDVKISYWRRYSYWI